MVTEGWLEPIPAVIGGEVGYNIYAVIQNVGTKFNYEFFSFLWFFLIFFFSYFSISQSSLDKHPFSVQSLYLIIIRGGVLFVKPANTDL